MISMATPRAELTGIERKKTLSCGAVRFTRPRPSVARNIRMIARGIESGLDKEVIKGLLVI